MRATFTHLIGPQKGTRAKFDDDRISIGVRPTTRSAWRRSAQSVFHHAEVIQQGDHFLLRDLGSTNGTMINGRRVMVSELAADDLIEFGAGGPLLRFAIERPNKKI
jgi:pSer/pThr/pTyr-binding forkhead associated (FHA) protein